VSRAPRISAAKAPLALSSGEWAEPCEILSPFPIKSMMLLCRGWKSSGSCAPPSDIGNATDQRIGGRWFNWSALMLCFSLLPTFAAALDVAQRTTEACLNAKPDDPKIVGDLAKIGWIQVPNNELTDQDILAISARMLGNRLGYGDVPKVRWLSEWALIQKSAAGIARIRSIAGAPTQRHFFKHSNAAGMVELTLQSLPKLSTVDCQITVSTPLADASLGIVASQHLTSDNPPIVFAPDQTIATDPAPKTVGITYYNPNRIPDLIDTSFPFVGTIWIRNSLKR
jgi:hypothetical protein